MRLATMTAYGPYYPCLWCQNPRQAVPLLSSLCDQKKSEWLPHMLEDLGSCFDCVVEYQRAKEDFLETHSDMKRPLYEFDVKRIRNNLESLTSGREQKAYDVIDVDGYVTVANRLRTPLLECLKYPNYLMHSHVNELFVQAFLLHSERSEDLDLDEKLPGVYQLLVHPNHQIRRWAIRTVRSLGTVSVNDFDDLRLVSQWLISVLEFGLLYDSPDELLADCIQPWDPESTVVLPRHLFDSMKPHDFWVGVCMFLKALDAQTLRTQLISGQHQVVDTIVSVFEDHHCIVSEDMDGMSAFWPALQCFVILLQRVESRLWAFSARNPHDVLNFVIYNRHYQAELLAMASLDTDEKEDKEEEMAIDDEMVIDGDADMSNSQIAYDWDGQSSQCKTSSKLQTKSFHATLFGWFASFLLSLVDFGDLAADQFKYIVRFLVRLPVRLRVHDSSHEGAMPLLKLRCTETLMQLLEEVLYRKLNKLVAHSVHEWVPVLVSYAQVQQPSHGFCDAMKIPLHELPFFGRLARKILLFLMKNTSEGSLKMRAMKFGPSLWPERSSLFGDECMVTVHNLAEEDTKQFITIVEEIVQGSTRKQRKSIDWESTEQDNLVAGMVDDTVESPLLFDDEAVCNEPQPMKTEQRFKFPTVSDKHMSDELGANVMSAVGQPADCLKTVTSVPNSMSNATAVEKGMSSDDCESTQMSYTEDDKKYSLLSDTSSETVDDDNNGDGNDDDDNDEDDDLPLVKRTAYVHSVNSSREDKGGSKQEAMVSINAVVTNSKVDSNSQTDSDDVTLPKYSRARRASRRAIQSSDPVGSSSSSESDEAYEIFEKEVCRKTKTEVCKRTKPVIEILDDSETEDEHREETIDPNSKTFNSPVTLSPATSTSLPFVKKAVLRLTRISPFRVNKPIQSVDSPKTPCDTAPRQKSSDGVQESKQVDSSDKDLDSDCRGNSVSLTTKKKSLMFETPSTKSVVDWQSSKRRRRSHSTEAVHPVHTFVHKADSEMKTFEDDKHQCETETTTKPLGETLSTNTEKERDDEQPDDEDDYNIANYLLDDNDRDVLMNFDDWDHCDPVTADTVVRVDALSCVEADLTQQVENSTASNDIRTPNKTQTPGTLFKQQTTSEKMEIQQQETPVHHKQHEFKVPAIPAPRPTGTRSDKKQALPVSSLPPQPGLKETAIALPKPITLAQIRTKPLRQLTADDLLLEVLSWDPNYITKSDSGRETRSNSVEPPSHLTRATRVQETFSSFQMYIEVFQPLLCLEVWEVVTKGLLSKQSKKPLFDACVTNVYQAADQAICSVRCDGQVSFADKQEWNHVVHGDLVLLKIVKSPLRPTNRPLVFAVVDFVQQSTVTLDMSQTSQGDEIGLTMTLKMRQNRWMPREKESVELKFVESLLTVMRQWTGLSVAHKNLLLRDILFPSSRQHFCSEEAAAEVDTLTVQHSKQKVFNESQSRAIVAATLSSLNVFTIPRICLLQGPPGTGKTHTVIGLLKTMLQESQLRVSGKVHILLCAPSNGAVDELVRRLVREVNISTAVQYGNSTGRSSRGFQIVRVGRASAIHPDVKPFGLNALVDQRISQEATGLQNQAMASLGAECTNIESRLKDVEKKLMFCRGLTMTNREQQILIIKDLEDQRTQLLDCRSKAEMQCRRIRGRVKDLQRHRTRIVRDVVLNADVVCCTLSGSGSHRLSSVLKNRPGASALPHFSCVVVDEAAQCCELDILVPLQYGSSKLILVGDPEQLPATVLSQKAESLGYGRSMFERFYSLFQRTMDKSPVLMLDMQYRMHPAICHFPSKRFYNNRLKSCSSLEQVKGWQFRPWLVYNMVEGEEECNAPGAMNNPVEAAMVVELCGVISRSISGFHIGVITPYNRQRQLISKQLKERLGQKLTSEIEVNTVDGFQGKEKDVIVLSCVRARHKTGAIGFLSHRQRLNVALTRAKKTLVVVGHLQSLRVNADWRALWDDAIERQAVVDVTDTDYGTAAKAVCLSAKVSVSSSRSTPTAGDPAKVWSSTSGVSRDQTPDRQGLSGVSLSQQGSFNKAKANGHSTLSDRPVHEMNSVTNADMTSQCGMIHVEQQAVRDHSVNVTSCVQDQYTQQTRDDTPAKVKKQERTSATVNKSACNTPSTTKTVTASSHLVKSSSSECLRNRQADNKTGNQLAASRSSNTMSRPKTVLESSRNVESGGKTNKRGKQADDKRGNEMAVSRSNSNTTSRTKTVLTSSHHRESSSRPVKDGQAGDKTDYQTAVPFVTDVLYSVTHEIYQEKICTGKSIFEPSGKTVKENTVGNQAADQMAASSVSGVTVAVTHGIHKDRISVTSRTESVLPSLEAGKASQRASNNKQRLSPNLHAKSAARSNIPITSGCFRQESETSSGRSVAASSNTKTRESKPDSWSDTSTLEAKHHGRDRLAAEQSKEPRFKIVNEPTSISWLSTRSGDKKSWNFGTGKKKAETSSLTKLQTSGIRPSNKRLLLTREPVEHPPKRPNHSGTVKSTTAIATVNEATYKDMGYTVLLKPRERVAHAGAATETKRKTVIHSNYYRKSSRSNDVGEARCQLGSETSSSEEMKSSEARTAKGTKSSSNDLLGSIMTDMMKRPSYG